MCTRLSMSVLELLVEEREKKTCLFLVKIEKKKKEKKKNREEQKKQTRPRFVSACSCLPVNGNS